MTVACRYILDRGNMKGMILLRIRSVQGRSGEDRRKINRVGHEIVGQDKIPPLLMHSTISVHLERVYKEVCFRGA